MRYGRKSLRLLTTETERKRLDSLDSFLGDLGYDPTLKEKDIDVLLRKAWKLPRDAQDRAVYVMRSTKFHEWVTGSESTTLLITANHHGSDRQSPVVSYALS